MSETATEQLEKTFFDELKEREKLVVSSIFFNLECRDWAMSKGVNDEYFQTKNLRRLMQAFNALSNVGIEPEESLIADQIYPSSAQDRAKLLMFFKRLREEAPPESSESIALHVEVLRNAHKLRKYGEMFQKAMEMVKNAPLATLSGNIGEIETFMESSLVAIAEESNGEENKTADMIEGYRLVIDNMNQKLHSESEERVTSGYMDLDEIMGGGFLKGTYAMICARPAMGKTVMMLNMCVEAARAGKRALFVSIEMDLLQCYQRIISKISGVGSDKLQRPENMRDADWKKLEDAGKEIVELVLQDRFLIEEVVAITVPQLERKIKHYKKTRNIDIVYVDYAQIMLTANGNEPEEASDYAQISGALRRTSKMQNVAIVVGSQLNREVERRTDKRPMMADIRNSGAFEQDAAQIFGLYRDVVYNRETTSPNDLEIGVLKNRFGPGSITIHLHCDLSTQRILSQAPAA